MFQKWNKVIINTRIHTDLLTNPIFIIVYDTVLNIRIPQNWNKKLERLKLTFTQSINTLSRAHVPQTEHSSISFKQWLSFIHQSFLQIIYITLNAWRSRIYRREQTLWKVGLLCAVVGNPVEPLQSNLTSFRYFYCWVILVLF